MKEYSKRSTPKEACRPSLVRLRHRKKTGEEFLAALKSPMEAYQFLAKHKFLKVFHACPFCNKANLAEPKEHRAEGQIHMKCNSYGCYRYVPVTHGSPFEGTRLQIVQLARAIQFYCTVKRASSCRASDMAAHCAMGFKGPNRDPQ